MNLTLACIVGNEEAVIERFLASFSPLVDEIVMVQAIGDQQPDQTMELAREYCRARGIRYRLRRYVNESPFPHVDHFGKARQMAWEIAAEGKTAEDFLMWADADDILEESEIPAIREAIESGHDLYMMAYHVRGDKQIVWRERIVRATSGSHWKFPIHEQLAFKNDMRYRMIRGAKIVHAPLATKAGARERNLNILTAQTESVGRNFFYLAQEYFQALRHTDFKAVAEAALGCPGLDVIERYELMIQLAQVPGTDSKRLAAEAFALMPDRREALALLCSYALVDQDHERALHLAQRMTSIPNPAKTYWSLNWEWYGWKGDALLNQCLRLNGRDEEAEVNEDSEIDLSRPRFSVIHATLDRPDKALAVREMWLSAADCPENVEYIFGLHEWDEKSRRALQGFKHAITDQKGPGWNYDTAAGLATGEIIIQAQDDCYPPQGWDTLITQKIGDPSAATFLAVSDGHREDLLSVNVVMTTAYMRMRAFRDPGENGFFHRGYPTVYVDTESSFRAIEDAKAGLIQYIHAPEIVIYHDHPMFNPELPWDSTYEFENKPEHYAQGRKLFEERNPAAGEDCLAVSQLESIRHADNLVTACS